MSGNRSKLASTTKNVIFLILIGANSLILFRLFTDLTYSCILDCLFVITNTSHPLVATARKENR
jgi:hypothetical protein